MNAYEPIDCDLHDYIEVACAFGYRLQVELLEGVPFVARALTTYTALSKEEFIVLEGEDGQRQEIRLDQLVAITPLDSDSRFGRVELRAQSIR